MTDRVQGRSPGGEPLRWLRLRYPALCTQCLKQLEPGDYVLWDKEAPRAWCEPHGIAYLRNYSAPNWKTKQESK
jgi:hypothetical protein